MNLLEGLGKRGGKGTDICLCSQSSKGIKECRSCLLLHLYQNRTHGMAPGVPTGFIGYWAIKDANGSYLLFLMSNQTRIDFDFAFFSGAFRCSALLLLWAEKSQEMAV